MFLLTLRDTSASASFLYVHLIFRCVLYGRSCTSPSCQCRTPLPGRQSLYVHSYVTTAHSETSSSSKWSSSKRAQLNIRHASVIYDISTIVVILHLCFRDACLTVRGHQSPQEWSHQWRTTHDLASPWRFGICGERLLAFWVRFTLCSSFFPLSVEPYMFLLWPHGLLCLRFLGSEYLSVCFRYFILGV